jgi:diaminobutyrate-2-oxoglutarate transaminase
MTSTSAPWDIHTAPPLDGPCEDLFPDHCFSQAYLHQQEHTESNARSYPRKLPLVIEKAEGLYVTDVDGAVYMDCLCGAGALALGHNHPKQLRAIREHLDHSRPMQTLDLTTPLKTEFVEELFATLPPELARDARIQFCSPSGADAVEAALKLVKIATGRADVWSMRGGFHGQTHGALALMGNLGIKSSVPGLMPGVQMLPFPYRYRCPMRSACEKCRCGDYVANALADPESGMRIPAAIITEVVQGEGGVIPADHRWLRKIRELTREHGILLIFDEVQTGWGRTGKMYAFEHSGVIPDVLVLSKAIGGGLPLAVVIYRKELDVWKPGAHSGTFRGNQLAMACGLATMRHIQGRRLPERAARMGKHFIARLSELAAVYPFIGDVRGLGLMLGVEVVAPEALDRAGHPRADPVLAQRIHSECFRRGLLLELGGRHGAVIRLLPPLTITHQQVDAVCDVLEKACESVLRPEPNLV